jgi:hypothetical protein
MTLFTCKKCGKKIDISTKKKIMCRECKEFMNPVTVRAKVEPKEIGLPLTKSGEIDLLKIQHQREITTGIPDQTDDEKRMTDLLRGSMGLPGTTPDSGVEGKGDSFRGRGLKKFIEG